MDQREKPISRTRAGKVYLAAFIVFNIILAALYAYNEWAPIGHSEEAMGRGILALALLAIWVVGFLILGLLAYGANKKGPL